MKKISVLIPCYNEEGNIKEIAQAIIKEMEKLNDYYLSNDIFNKSRELSTINYKLLDDNNDLTR